MSHLHPSFCSGLVSAQNRASTLRATQCVRSQSTELSSTAEVGHSIPSVPIASVLHCATKELLLYETFTDPLGDVCQLPALSARVR